MATPSPALRLTRLRIKNFRSIGEMDVALGPLTVLVGPNGAGKSNVVDALRFLRDCFSKGLDQAVLDREGMKALRHWSGGKLSSEVSLGVTVNNEWGVAVSYDIVLAAGTRGNVLVKREEARLKTGGQSSVALVAEKGALLAGHDNEAGRRLLFRPGVDKSSHLQGLDGLATGIYLLDREETALDEDKIPTRRLEKNLSLSYLCYTTQELLQDALFYAPNPAQLRPPQRLTREAPLDEEGQNLAAVLRNLLRSKRSADELRQTLRRLVSGVTDISVGAPGSFLVTYLHYQEAGSKVRKSDLGQESDGTLRALGILAALLQPFEAERGRYGTWPFLAIEEPEVNIHPGMLAVLAESFREASLQRQLLLTTHSPELLDFLPPESFLVVEKVNGKTVVGPLATDQSEIIRKRLFTPGELLRTEGLHRQDDAPAQTTADAA